MYLNTPLGPDDTFPAVYTKTELRTLCCTLLHPSVEILEILLRRAVGPSTDSHASDVLEKFTDNRKISRKVFSGLGRFCS